jgi:tRNA-specific 2-thiouridylase
VDPYVADHAAGRTPNPCIECNRHLKFDRFLARADRLGFDAVVTGHHARVVAESGGGWSLRRGADSAKDQSYVLHMLGQEQLARVLLPVGEMSKAEVRSRAGRLGLRTAAKPDSQDVCFISRTGGRGEFLGRRIELHPGDVVDEDRRVVGTVPAVELVTVGQRRGLGPAAGGRYAVAVEPATRTVRVGPLEDLTISEVRLSGITWVGGEPVAGEALEAQTSAHGRPVPARWESAGRVRFDVPVRKVAPGQSVVLYRADAVVGGGTALA